MSEFVKASFSVSKEELDAMKSPEDLADVVELYCRCAVECMMQEIGDKYPHLVKTGDYANAS